jgi:hypothetical protein
MARGRRNDRPRSSVPPGRAEPIPGAGSAAGPADATRRDELAGYETVEFEEIDATDRTAMPPPRDAVGGEGAQRTGDHVMSQPDQTSETSAAEPLTETQPYSQPAAATERRGGGGRGFLAGLIGGLLGTAAVVGGGGWYAYEHGPVKPAVARFAATESSARAAETGVADLGQRLTAVSTNLDGLNAALEQRAAASDQRAAELAAMVASLGDRVAATEKATADLATMVEQASNSFRAAGEEVIGRLKAVNAKLVEVEQAQPADIVDKKTVGDIAAKQAGIEQGQQEVAAGLARLEGLVTQSLEAGNQQAAALRTVVDSTRSRLDEVVAQQRELMALQGQVAQLAQTNEQQTAAIQTTEGRIGSTGAELQQRIDEVTARLTKLDAARERGVGVSIATHDLELAMETGRPFKPTLEILNQLSQGDPAISGAVAKLDPVADSGVPTIPALAGQLREIEQSLEPAPTSEPQDWLGRTRDNLESLVNLHPAGEEAVPGLNAVQDAGQALLQQDVAGAVAALTPLAQQGNAQAKAWIESAQKRLDAAAAVETLRQQVKTMLAQQG